LDNIFHSFGKIVKNKNILGQLIIRTLAKSMPESAYGTGVASNLPQT